MGTRRKSRRIVRRLFAASDRPGVRALLAGLALASVITAWEIIAAGLWQNEFEAAVEREIRNDVFGRYANGGAREAVLRRGNPYSLFW